MCKFKIVSDSSSNTFDLNMDKYNSCEYNTVPLKIVSGNKEFVDDRNLDTEEMINSLCESRGKSMTSCPNVQEWLDAFEGAEYIFAITISSVVSGSNNSAETAAKIYLEDHPETKIHIIDSLSTGPEMALIIDKITEYIKSGMSFENIISEINNYMKRTHLLFCLYRMDNLVKNGRVSAAAAKLANLLGIRILGQAGEKGTIDPVQKCRGEKQTINAIIEKMKSMHFTGGKVRIDHCLNLKAAKELKEKIISEFKNAIVEINITGGLCSYYAEKGGLMIGFESF